MVERHLKGWRRHAGYGCQNGFIYLLGPQPAVQWCRIRIGHHLQRLGPRGPRLLPGMVPQPLAKCAVIHLGVSPQMFDQGLMRQARLETLPPPPAASHQVKGSALSPGSPVDALRRQIVG